MPHEPAQHPTTQSGAATRRTVLGTAALGVAAASARVAIAAPAPADAAAEAPQAGTTAAPQGLVTQRVTLAVNGHDIAMTIEPRTSLLDALRENAGLTGTKKGCDHGACGACTVHLDGHAVVSCLTLAARCQGHAVTTIEGLSRGDALHPMQAAFVAHDALQCGYCTPGQIMAAVALAKSGRATSPDAIREGMSGNICRCGAYPNIVAAITEGAAAMQREG